MAVISTNESLRCFYDYFLLFSNIFFDRKKKMKLKVRLIHTSGLQRPKIKSQLLFIFCAMSPADWVGNCDDTRRNHIPMLFVWVSISHIKLRLFFYISTRYQNP